jgi:hypothetical protein
MKKLLLTTACLLAITTFTVGPVNAKKLCMSTVPEGDKFYAQCKKCEKNVGECTGELRDRMRKLLSR